MKLFRRVSTTFTLIMTYALWEEINTPYLHDISVLTKSIRLSIVNNTRETDKHYIILTVTKNMNGKVLPKKIL